MTKQEFAKMSAGGVAQGDVLIIEIPNTSVEGATLKEIPRDNGRVVIEYGEVTGHCHAVTTKAAHLYSIEKANPELQAILDCIDTVNRDSAKILHIDESGELIVAKTNSGDVEIPGDFITHDEHDPIHLKTNTTYLTLRQTQYTPAGMRLVAD